MQNSFFKDEELHALGFKSVGQNVLISRLAQFYMIENIELGNNIRIDDFSILSGRIKLNDNVHISAYCALYGKYEIELKEYTGLSPRCTIFSASDDFSGDYLIGPMVNQKYTNLNSGKILIKKYTQLGCNCVVLPNITIEEGVAVGAMSLVNKDLEEWSIYVGIPVRFIKHRSKKLLDFIDAK